MAKETALAKRMQGSLSLPGLEITHNSLTLPEKISEEDWLRLLDAVAQMDQANPWWFGGALNGLSAGQYMQRGGYEEFRGRWGLSKGTLKTYKAIDKAFPKRSIRIDLLLYGHYRAVWTTFLTPEEQQSLLEQAAEGDNGKPWPVSRLAQEVREVRKQKQLGRPLPDGPIIYQQDAIGFLESLEEHGTDLLLTDPPYSTDVDDILTFAAGWLPVAISRVKPSGQAFIFTGAYPEELRSYLDVLLDDGRMAVTNVMVWTQESKLGPSPKNAYANNWQAIFYLRGPDAADLDCPMLTEQFAVQRVEPDRSAGVSYSPWQKPDDLAERLLRHTTKAGDLVIDPFAGTGTFLLKAHEIGRHAVGCDLDAEMIKIATGRGCRSGKP